MNGVISDEPDVLATLIGRASPELIRRAAALPHPRDRFRGLGAYRVRSVGLLGRNGAAGIPHHDQEELMKLFTSGRYAAVASTAALVVALGGTSYAAAQITSGDIKDGTIQTKDGQPERTDHRQARSTTTTRTAMDRHHQDGASVNLKPGKYVVTGKAQRVRLERRAPTPRAA